jgi:hypothetical protein
MAEILGIGLSHAPHLQFTDHDMSNILRRLLKGDRIPAEMKDPRNWPEQMRREWSDDEGLGSARQHRAELVEGLRKVRAAIDAFRPDFVLIWGDDQYENFHEDLLTPFCAFAFDEVLCAPFKQSDGLGASANVWNEPSDKVLRLSGHREAAVFLTDALIQKGFDVACAYKLHHAETLSHAFTRTVLYLDYDRAGFDIPIVPFHVNCYGRDLRIPAGRIVGSPPPSPPPWRCYDAGRETARILAASPWRVAVIGSSSWSHGTLTRKNHFMYPDMDADRQRLEELRSGDTRKWRELDPEQMRGSGQHEMLNWICLAGAMEGRRPDILAFSERYIFNSNKAVVLYPLPSAAGAVARPREAHG